MVFSSAGTSPRTSTAKRLTTSFWSIMSPRLTMSGLMRLMTSLGLWSSAASSSPITRSASRMAETSGVVMMMASLAEPDGVLEALFDAGGAVDKDVVEVLFKAGAKPAQLLGVDAVLVAGLGSGDQVKLVVVLVANHGLLGLAVAFEEVDQVVDDAVLEGP